jgi:hypothetical protein
MENMGHHACLSTFFFRPAFFPLLHRSHQNNGKLAVAAHGKVLCRRHSVWSAEP